MTIKLVWESLGTHKRVTIFCGADGDHLAYCGRVIFRNDEATRFRNTVRMGIQGNGFDGILESGWEDDAHSDEHS